MKRDIDQCMNELGSFDITHLQCSLVLLQADPCLGSKMPSAYLNMALFDTIMSVNMSYTSQHLLLLASTDFPIPASQEKGFNLFAKPFQSNKFTIK